MKICTKCNTEKQESDFRKRKSKSGLQSHCKLCEKEYSLKYQQTLKHKQTSEYSKNLTDEQKNKIKAAQKIYRLNNKEKEALRKKRWAADKLEILKEKAKNYYVNNKDRIKNNSAKYKKTNKGKEVGKLVKAKRNSLKKTTSDNTITADSLRDLRTKQNNSCYYCNISFLQIPEYHIHLDHYIPISKGGIHSITNVVWSCAKCNQHKSDTMPEKALN